MTFVYLPYDLIGKLFVQEIADAQEVWFGITLRGWAAKASEPLHWAIYGILTWGFWRERPWVGWAAALYVAQVAIGMVVWSTFMPEGHGLAAGLAMGAPFAILAVALWRAEGRFAV